MKVKLSAGAELDLLTQAELAETLADRDAQREIEKLRGVKWMELPEELHGAAVGGVLLLGATGPRVGPEEGYIWCIKRLVVGGLTSGATPDIVNLYRNDVSRPPQWTFTGNANCQTFTSLAQTLRGGDYLILANVGTFASTAVITLSGELIQVPAQLAGKLA